MNATATETIDKSKTDAFTERLVGALNDTAVMMSLSIGHRTGLFDTMAEMPPATSDEIARQAKLQERYVREWLGAMVTGRIVEYDPEQKTYHLPAEHATVLTRDNNPNMAVTAQWIGVLGQVEDRIIDCFRTGGGVPYSAYNRFHEVMAEESAQTVVAEIVNTILPLAPGVVDRLREGIDTLDVGCGAGRAVLRMAEEFPRSRLAGYDFSEEAISSARKEAPARGLKNARFEVRDAAAIGETARYDLITAFDAIHDQRDPTAVLSQIAQALRPGGTFLMQDIDTSSHLHKNMNHPVGPFLYTISTMHCMTVSLALGGAGLGTCWGEELACQMLAEAGFHSVQVHRLPHDFMNCFYVCKKER